MTRSELYRWGAAIFLATALVGAGCAKKETVRSEQGAPPAVESPAAPKTEVGPPPRSEAITETTKPEAPAAQAGGTQTAMAEAAAGVAVTEEKASPFDDIRFDFDKFAIRSDAKPILQKVADLLKNEPSATLLVEGHCDERGTPEYNMALGQRRAESAKSYLVSLGIKAGRVSTVSFGEEKPADPGHNEEAWAKNRRAHFVKK